MSSSQRRLIWWFEDQEGGECQSASDWMIISAPSVDVICFRGTDRWNSTVLLIKRPEMCFYVTFSAFPPSFNWDVWISSDLWVTETTRGRLTRLYTKQFVRYCWKWFLVNLLIIHLVTHRLSGSERRDEDTYYNRHHLGKEAWSTRGTVTKTLSPTRLPLNPKKNQHTLPVDTKAQNGGVAVLKAVVNTYWNIATNAD